MFFKDLVVYIDTTSDSETGLDVAVNLAERHGAHLKGVPVSGQCLSRHAESKAGGAAGELFRQATAAAGISAEWLASAAEERTDALIRHAHCNDLVIVGQPDDGGAHKLAQRLILEAGRPVLVIPYAGRFADIGSRVIVALTGGKESTRASRAVHDAMPLLLGAQQVTFLEVVAGASAAIGGKELCPDLHGHLQRHGLNPSFDLVAAGGYPVADILLNHASDGGFDLLVMGANIHASTLGVGLGPVTEQILRQMTLPVLMAH